MMGPNVKRLIVRRMSQLMVPAGAALAAGIRELTTPGNIAKRCREATAWVEEAIDVVKTAPDNPYGNDDEAIAGEILKQIEKR